MNNAEAHTRADPHPPLEILYVNGNTGAAAGGHVALRMGDEVFHYQFLPGGRFLLVRETWARFRLIYNRLRNRSIQAAELVISRWGYEQIKAQFLTVLARQRRDLMREKYLRRSSEMLDELASGKTTMLMPGAGFFAEPGTVSGYAELGKQLRSTLEKRLGAPYLGREIKRLSEQIRRAIEQINGGPDSAAQQIPRLDELVDLIERKSALNLLQKGAGLNVAAVLAPQPSYRLDSLQLRRLDGLLKDRLGILTNLILSKRRGSGTALLLEIARCQALALSLEQRRLITLDPYPDEAPTRRLDFADTHYITHLHEVSGMLDARIDLLLAPADDTGQGADVLLLTQLENSNGRLVELDSALRDKSTVRLGSELMVPSRAARVVVEEMLSQPVQPELAAHLAAYQQTRLEAQQRGIETRYNYQLISRNCVNELLRAINGSFTGADAAARELGAYIDPQVDRITIPHDFFYQVCRCYHIGAVREYRSRRLDALRALKDQHPQDWPILLWLREGNTLSSTLYETRIEDTPFLFFTDTSVWARPPLGALNLAWSALAGLGGILKLPLDGGEQLHHSYRGILYSLPELLFCNIRKGTYGYDDLSTRTGGL